MMIPYILSILSIFLCVLFFFFFRWYIKRKTAARELLSDYRAEVFQLIVEIDSATDRDSLLVEERIKTLRKILDDTDRRISVYMRELQRSRNGELMYTSLGRGIRVALDSSPATQEPIQQEAVPQELFPQESLPQELAQETVQETAPPKETAPPQEAMPPQEETQTTDAHREKSKRKPAKHSTGKTQKPRLKAQIAEMTEQGLSPQKIASRLNVSLAEVDLALNLLNRSS